MIHADRQQTDCDAWSTLCRWIDAPENCEATELILPNIVGHDGCGSIVELPKSLRRLKKLRHLSCYGSNLVRVPAWITDLQMLEELDLYCSYRLHWLPFELVRMPALTKSRISTRALFGNYKYRAPFADLLLLRQRDGLEAAFPSSCSICSSPMQFDDALIRWVTLRIATDVVPLLVFGCSPSCLDRVPESPENYVQGIHTGGIAVQQPPPR